MRTLRRLPSANPLYDGFIHERLTYERLTYERLTYERLTYELLTYELLRHDGVLQGTAVDRGLPWRNVGLVPCGLKRLFACPFFPMEE